MSINDQQDDQPIGPAGEKLQKVLARIGVGSRRDVEAWISHGRIKVNGKDATLGQRVDMHDAITIDGKVIKRFAPTTKPEELTAEIEALLK